MYIYGCGGGGNGFIGFKLPFYICLYILQFHNIHRKNRREFKKRELNIEIITKTKRERTE